MHSATFAGWTPFVLSAFVTYSVTSQVEHSGSYMYVAPIGTKPHALGALLYFVSCLSDCEIIYDHPTSAEGWDFWDWEDLLV